MKVTLIDYTGAESLDIWYAARLLIYTKNTRLELGQDTRARVDLMSNEDILKELDYISKTLRSSWEFVDFTFEITGVTRAFTHQFVRTRTGSYAQQAMRVVDMGDFETLVPESVIMHLPASSGWNNLMKYIRGAYKNLRQLGIPAQDARGILPTNILTNIIAKFNLRTMADLAGKRQNLRAQGEYQAVYFAMAAEVLRVMPWTEKFLYPERTNTPALDSILGKVLGGGQPTDNPELNAALKELDMLKGIWG